MRNLPPAHSDVSILTKFRNAAVKWLVLSYLVTLAAQIGTTPLIAYYFFRAYPLGIFAGPFAVGLVSVIVAVGMVSVCIGFIWLPFAKLLALLNHAVISIFLALIGYVWTDVGCREVNATDVGYLCLLYDLLFWAGALAVCL